MTDRGGEDENRNAGSRKPTLERGEVVGDEGSAGKTWVLTWPLAENLEIKMGGMARAKSPVHL